MVRWGGKTHSTITLVKIPGVTREYTGDDTGELVPVVAFECRGCEPIAWHPGEGMVAEGVGGEMFEDIGAWAPAAARQAMLPAKV